MIQVVAQMRILVAVKPADFRRGIDGLARLCREALATDPFSGALFVFCNRRRTAVKILAYDGRGFWLCHHRLSRGRLRWWPSGEQASCSFEGHDLHVLLAGGDPRLTQAPEPWRSVRM